MMRVLAEMLRRIGHTRFFQRVAPLLAGPVDRFLYRITRGRFTLSEHVAPMLFLHHRGRRSGREYRTPLFYARLDGGWAVVATNFGRESHPAWSENLLASPSARVEVGGRWHEVHAELADEQQEGRAWNELRARWPAYDVYRQRAAHRDIRVFVLRPRDVPGH
ncbi:MAG: nitroreductase family deazaflavin-dependent oxidoreductase [Nitriliruptorales bacterium]|nr:nitroreductase family deazaflavin-dependent oxidoreductase [Nitriliruptorales bacterium]